MLKQLVRLLLAWTPVLTAALVLGPLAGLLTSLLRDASGGTHATLLVNATPVLGIAVAIGVCVLAAAGGWFGVMVRGPNVGVLSAGIVLAWAAARSARLDEMVLATHRSPLPSLVLEGLLVALLAAAVIEVIRRTRRDQSVEPSPFAIARALGAGAVAAGLTAWVVAVTPMKGQTLAAAVAAGIMGAAVARMFLLAVPPRLVVLIPACLAVASPLISMVLADDPVAEVIGGTVFRLGYILPLDWLAGAMVGIPLGLAWTESVVDQQTVPPGDDLSDDPGNEAAAPRVSQS